MITAHEVESAAFDKVLRGYNVEQVDEFLDRITEQLNANEQRIQELTNRNAEMKDTIVELGHKLDGYHEDENALKSALLNAQRMGENVIREARQKADVLERESRIRSEDILRTGREQIKEQEIELERIKAEVAQFKATILNLYKMHIESLSQLPDSEPAEAQQPAQAAPAEAEQDAAPVAEPAAEPETEPAAQPEAEEVTEADADKEEAAEDSFRGISFSD